MLINNPLKRLRAYWLWLMIIAPGMVIYVSCAYRLPFRMMNRWVFGNSAQISTAEIGKHNNWKDTIKLKASALQRNYKADKAKIITTKRKLAAQYKLASDTLARQKILDSANKIFTLFLLNNIIPHWYGTKWDFNGYTETPKQGVIACGYLVSTTLKDMGLNVNRYKLAQQSPINEAKTIAIHPDAVQQFSFIELSDAIKGLNSGLYFIGVYNHVGYMFKQNDAVYAIHSNYFDQSVVLEQLLASKAFYSPYYYVAKITDNKSLLTCPI